MASEIVIEPAKETDLPSIRELLQQLTEAVADTEGFDLEKSIQNCRVLLEGTNNHMLVARYKGDLAGFVNFTVRKTIMHPQPSGLIDELVVSRDNRNKGIGKKLIEAVIAKCKDLGCCEVEVSTEKGNTGARRFYKACGFEEHSVFLEIDL